ncbi:MAG: hypothetical protein HY548_01370, partial [Elusimicrobia bacterium]|nr:hypothetical protein [Elusimicrobiota bacterium]
MSPPEPAFQLSNPGTEAIVDYDNYGHFDKRGFAGYRYLVMNPSGLAAAMGEGIYPNSQSIRKNPEFQRYLRAGRLEGSPWDVIYDPDIRKSFFKWAIYNGDPGIKLFYTAFQLERAGLWAQAVKAYHACLVHFPKSHQMTNWGFPWYIGPAALDRLQFLLKTHSELGLALEGTDLEIQNGHNKNVHDDVVICDPGRLVRRPENSARPEAPWDLSRLRSRAIFQSSKTRLVQYENGHWRLFVDGETYPVRAVTYQPNVVGLSPDDGTLNPTLDWMTSDIDRNGRIDGPYDAWVDRNGDNKQDWDERPVGDFALMKDMGVNTIRIYHHDTNQELLTDLYRKYGIRVLMGDMLGAYTIGSGADWSTGTDYTNPEHLRLMRESVEEMVRKYKDNPAVLMWVLGNENIYGVKTNAPDHPENFYTFANEMARWIKSVDPEHPVVLANGDLYYLDLFSRLAPDIDVFGCNAYRGDHGFGQSLWKSVQRACEKPVLITEFGCPAYLRNSSQ